MTLEKRVEEVEALYQKLEQEIAGFQAKSKLSCYAGCGKCCTSPQIDASPLEFLPWALHLFLNGKAEKTLGDLENHTSANCYLYHSNSATDYTIGSCKDYKYRGLICRLFGYGASKDKYGQLRLATCQIIKEKQKETFEKGTIAINNGLAVPIFTDYYMNLSQIDFKLGNIILPINQAIIYATKEVLHYYAYRELPNELCC